jgi:hypothetical protein
MPKLVAAHQVINASPRSHEQEACLTGTYVRSDGQIAIHYDQSNSLLTLMRLGIR